MFRFCSLFVLLFICGLLHAGPSSVMDAAEQRIVAFHTGEKPSSACVRVVYFYAADREPLPNFEARLDRVMTNISGFYRDEMEHRFAVKTNGLPLERKDGKLVIHLVRGQQPAEHYHYDSGDETWREVCQALAGTIDPEHEHVLILYGFCEHAPDGHYVFTAPFYGVAGSDQRHGLSHAADCDLLDPALLTQKDVPFVFTEHYYPRVESNVAKFNSWYLGGLAHELGHGLGFPHDNGGPDEAPDTSLMSRGNFHYREDLWGGRNPACLALATALRFAAHPLTTQSNKARWQPAETVFENLTASSEKGTLRLTGRVRASIPPCAIIASAWPIAAPTDHGAITFCAAVDDEGKFSVTLTNLNAPSWNLHLGCLLVNGAESLESFTFTCNARGEPDTEFLAERMVDVAEQTLMRHPAQARELLTEEAIAAAPSEEARHRLRLLRTMQSPESEPIELSTTNADRVFLSDARWTRAEVGWGKVVRNRYSFNQDQWEGMLIKIQGKVFDKGLYAHANSVFVFPAGGNWKTFTAMVGLQDGATDQGSAVFTVLGDGKEIFRSEILRPRQQQTLRLDVPGVQELELRTEGGEGHNHNSWAVWANPVLQR